MNIIEQALNQYLAECTESEAHIAALLKVIKPLEEQYCDQLILQAGLVQRRYCESVELNDEKGVLVNSLTGLLQAIGSCPSCRSIDQNAKANARETVAIMTNAALRKTAGKLTGC